MTAFQTGEEVIFLGFFTSSGVGVAGLTDVAITIHHETISASTLVLNAAACSDVGNGFYKYVLTNPPSSEGVLRARFVTADATVDAKEIVVATPYGQVWTDNLDAAISSRSASGAVITSISPVGDGDVLTIYAGADYADELANEIQFIIDTPTNYSAATFNLKVGDFFSKSGVLVSSSSSQITVEFKPTSSETSALKAGRYTYQVQATLSGKEAVLVSGICHVIRML